LDARQFCIVFVELLIMLLRKTAESGWQRRFANSVQERLDGALLRVRERLEAGVYDAELVGRKMKTKQLMVLFCVLLRKSMERDESRPSLMYHFEHGADLRLRELFFNMEKRLRAGDFDPLVKAVEEMVVDANARSVA
jgi:hypothetical protein